MPQVIGTQYQQYINSSAWRKKRQERLDHDNRRCMRCDETGGLEVHHITYDRLGSERLEDLLTLCGGCHAREHGRDPDSQPAMPDSFYHKLWLDRERMLIEQERLAEAAGIDLDAVYGA